MVVDDRRHFQRLKLPKPILAQIDGQSALLLDVGVGGAFVEHYGKAESGTRFRLAFRWHGDEVEFLCEVARSRVVRPSADSAAVVSHSGVRFVQAFGESDELLQEMMATFIGRVLAAQRANASGDRTDETLLGSMGDARRTRSRGFVSYRFRNGVWSRDATQSPTQPSDGFTVAAFEEEEEIETLCRTYETADEEARGLIRLVAELSAMNVKK